jgi:hypothetical protein
MSIEVEISKMAIDVVIAVLGPLQAEEFWYGVFVTLAFVSQIRKIIGSVMGGFGQRLIDKATPDGPSDVEKQAESESEKSSEN